jgi:hypothetical protein
MGSSVLLSLGIFFLVLKKIKVKHEKIVINNI